MPAEKRQMAGKSGMALLLLPLLLILVLILPLISGCASGQPASNQLTGSAAIGDPASAEFPDRPASGKNNDSSGNTEGKGNFITGLP